MTITPPCDATPVVDRGNSSSSRPIAFHPDDYTHPCHPLYVHPSDVLGASLVSTPFDGTSYGSWCRNILVALSVHNKLDFINDTTEKPPDGSPLVRQWQRCNDLVVPWLTNSLTKEISRSVEYSELAKDIWRELEERYDMADGARIFELKKELSHISQGPLDIASYFNKIKQLWDEIVSISVNHLSVCTFGGNKKDDEEQKVYQFLMGLNETYLQVRSNILMIKPLPSMSKVYGILLSNEKQRQVSSISQFHSNSNSASFNAGVSKQSFPSKVTFNPQKPDNQRSSIICKYCKKPGHSVEKCYKLHGFPQNFKFTKVNTPRRTATHVEVQSPVNSDETRNAGGPAMHTESKQLYTLPGLTKDQYS
ncbi:uncharacterized protein LOC142163213 [Nicotiana tabacum]|uniref:Uncharacterized protein LOC142163213 n=1 Tax=Nicotiana tabacum TaxID=4097 RepID=A0AC58RV21_TOBAC